MVQSNRIENLEGDPDLYGQVIFNKGAKADQWERIGFQQMTLEQLNIQREGEIRTLNFVP